MRHMRISPFCEECLYQKERSKSENEDFLKEVRKLLEERDDQVSAPYMIYFFKKLYAKYGIVEKDWKPIKKQYNDLALSMEESIRKKIFESEDPLARAILYSRIGNYIDFGAMKDVDDSVFLKLFDQGVFSKEDWETYESFALQLKEANNFLLITDNCGEIVFDKLLLKVIKERFPKLHISVMVRGEEALNDATLEDAYDVGIDRYADTLLTNEKAITGTVYSVLSESSKKVIDQADIILAKGQGNYESLSSQGFHVFYLFLCKCQKFIERFSVPKLTGMFIEESPLQI